MALKRRPSKRQLAHVRRNGLLVLERYGKEHFRQLSRKSHHPTLAEKAAKDWDKYEAEEKERAPQRRLRLARRQGQTADSGTTTTKGDVAAQAEGGTPAL